VGVLHEHRVIIPFADAIIKPATTSSPGEGNLTGDISSVQIFFLFYPLSGPHERREGGANKHEVNNGRFGTTIALLKGVWSSIAKCENHLLPRNSPRNYPPHFPLQSLVLPSPETLQRQSEAASKVSAVTRMIFAHMNKTPNPRRRERPICQLHMRSSFMFFSRIGGVSVFPRLFSCLGCCMRAAVLGDIFQCQLHIM